MKTTKILLRAMVGFSINDAVVFMGKPYSVTHISENEIIIQRKGQNGLYNVEKIKLWDKGSELMDILISEEILSCLNFQLDKSQNAQYIYHDPHQQGHTAIMTVDTVDNTFSYWSVINGHFESTREIRTVRELQHMMNTDGYQLNVKPMLYE